MEFKDATGGSRISPPNVSSPGSPKGGKTINKQLSSEAVTEALAGAHAQGASPSLQAKKLSSISSSAVSENAAVGEAEKKAIEEKDGFLWKCVARIHVPEGKIYRFRLRDEYDFISEPRKGLSVEDRNVAVAKNIQTMIDAISPAVENPGVRWSGSCNNVGWSFGERDIFEGAWERASQVAKELGYKVEYTPQGVFVEYPDKDVFDARWKKIMFAHPDWNLKPMTILSSEGIASDKDFLDAFEKYDTILSTGREFFHDQEAHVLSRLVSIVEYPVEYPETKRKSVQLVKQFTPLIEGAREWLRVESEKENPSEEKKAYLARLKKNLDHAEVIPAIFADNFAAFFHPSEIESFAGSSVDAMAQWVITNNRLDMFLKRTYPDPEFSVEWMWGEITKISQDKKDK